MTRIRNVIGMLAVGVIALSCGEARGPLESTTEVNTQLPESAFAGALPAGGVVVFGDAALARAKRSVGGPMFTERDGDVVKSSKDGKLKVKFRDYDGPVRVKEAEFKIEKNSITNATPLYKNYYLVGMQVETGKTLEDIRVKFYPSGMTFTEEATLTLKIRGKLSTSSFKAYHIQKNGTVTEPEVKLKGKKEEWELEVKVPGFSEYTYDDDPMNEEGDEGP